jgi:uncharacterized sulfatase
MRAFIPWLLPLSLAAQSPSAHWSFDGADSSTRLRESYGRSALNATEVSGVSAWAARTGFGETLANGANTPHLSVANQAAIHPGSGGFSISLWSFRTTDDAAPAGLVDALNGSGTGYQWFYQANGTLRARLDDDLGNFVLVDTTASHAGLNVWRHLVLTVDRATATARIHVDGIEATPPGGVSIAALTGQIIPDQNLWIGTLNANTAAKGRIDDLAWFPRVITPAEIASLRSGSGVPVLTVWPADPPPPAVAITPAGGILRDGEMVTLSSAPGAVIRYTTDGSDPVATSTLYTAPFPLPASATVRARVVVGDTPGEIASASFVRLPASRPNVVILTTPGIGAGDLSCYGAPSTSTPRLDQLAAAGSRFTGLCAVSPGSTSSSYALHTGRAPRRAALPTVVAPEAPGIDRREWTLAESLRKAGYETAFIGAWKLGSAPGSGPLDQGFTLFHGLPWSPDQSPAPMLMENTAVLGPAPADPYAAFAARAESYLSSPGTAPFLLMLQMPAVPAGGSSLLGPVGNRIEAFDALVGRVLDRIDQLGIASHTLVLFVSESTAERSLLGPSIGSNGQFRDAAGTTWDGGLRLPAIARWPGVIPPGIDNLATLWLPDLLPSLAAIAAGWLPTDRPMDGISRPEVLLGVQRRTAGDTVIFHHRRNGANDLIPAARSGPWKLHVSTNQLDPGNATPGAVPLLYQTEIDPSERTNLASAQAPRVAEMQAAITAHAASFAAPVTQLPPAQPPFLGAVTPHEIGGDGSLRLTFLRPTASLDDRYLLEFSTDLVAWAAEPMVPESVMLHPDGTETVVVAVPADHPRWTGSRCFVRLRADHP